MVSPHGVSEMMAVLEAAETILIVPAGDSSGKLSMFELIHTLVARKLDSISITPKENFSKLIRTAALYCHPLLRAGA